jgi:hypothetical protein
LARSFASAADLEAKPASVHTAGIYHEEARMETAKLFMNGRSQAVRLPKGLFRA